MRAISLHAVLLLLVPLWPLSVYADIRLFTEHSLESIAKARENRPFLLVLWSVECPPCMKELDLLGKMRAKYPIMDIVLIAVDDGSALPQVKHVLKSFELMGVDNWIFSDIFAGRLRYQIDQHWFGEVPRAYFYSSDHERRAFSGALTVVQLTEWVRNGSLPGAAK